MIFMEYLNKQLNSFTENVENEVLKKFIIGFYQISDSKLSKIDNFDMDLIDRKKLKIKVINFLKSITSIKDQVLKSTPSEEMASFLTNIAHMYASAMMVENSLNFYRESINIRENYLKVKSLATAENYQSIGIVYEKGGSFDVALSYYKKSLALRKELSYVENNLLVAESYSRLALVYYHLESYGLALGYIEDTIKIREKLLPSNHTLLESSYYNHKFIEKESQPKKDYLRLLLGPIHQGIGLLIKRFVGQK